MLADGAPGNEVWFHWRGAGRILERCALSPSLTVAALEQIPRTTAQKDRLRSGISLVVEMELWLVFQQQIPLGSLPGLRLSLAGRA